MTQPAKSQEPSMEEILASIRRIIADDDANKATQQVQEAPRSAAPAAPAARPAVLPPRAPPPPPRVDPPLPSPVEAEPAAGGGGNADDQSSDILELTESMATSASAPPAAMPGPASHFRTIDGHSDVDFDEVSDKPVAQGNGGAQAHLISKATSAAVDSAFNTLAQTVLVQNAKTLEDLVREMLRPMLKTWLDENLPGMVERLVRAEIERVSRGH
jgi:uncharacterized protein